MIKKLIHTLIIILHFICVVVGAIVIVGLLTWLLRSCYYDHKPEAALYGNWSKVDSEDCYNDHILTFDWDGEYYNSNTGNEPWNYQLIGPDSLILYHHGFYEERYRILHLTEDTLTIKLSESIVHVADQGKEIEAPYGDGSMPLYTYIRINHSTIPKY